MRRIIGQQAGLVLTQVAHEHAAELARMSKPLDEAEGVVEAVHETCFEV